MSSLRAILVDDESDARANLEIQLKKYCPDIKVMGKASSAIEARELIISLKPNVLFLDIQMPGENGFDLLKSVKHLNPLVVFVTAHEEFAIRALRANAVDYLLKPLDGKELMQLSPKLLALATNSAQEENFSKEYNNSLNYLIEDFESREELKRIVLPVTGGYKVVEIKEVVRLESSNNYTRVFFKDQRPLLISRALKEFEDLLPSQYFCRVHNSHVINLNYLIEFSRTDGGIAHMNDGVNVPIARRRLKGFKEALSNVNPIV